MRTLIDGYNVMHAGGLMDKKFKPDGFRQARARFLNDLASALGAVDANATTVVFDAASSPPDVPAELRHKGIAVVFAVDDEDADLRIELLIAAHSAPKTLTVVSSDRRIRQAASRRKAITLSADDYWRHIDALKSRPRTLSPPPARPAPAPLLSDRESRYWQHEFRDVIDAPEVHRELNPGSAFLTDEEIAQLEREIELEP